MTSASPPRPTPGYSRRQLYLFAGCVGSLLVLGWIDFITGYELGFFIIYSLPVGLVAWHLGRWPAILMALLASIAWWLADSFDGAKYSNVFYWVWNNLVHFLSFVINAVAIAKIKAEFAAVHQLAADLETARHALRVVAPQLTACPGCGRAHPAVSDVSQAVLSVGEKVPPELAAALCADCAARSS